MLRTLTGARPARAPTYSYALALVSLLTWWCGDMPPVPYSVVHHPFVGPLDESVEPALLEQGFTEIENGSFEEQGKIRKRPGTTELNSALSGTPDVERFIKWKDALLVATGQASGRLLRPNASTMLEVTQQMSECTVRRKAIERSIQDNVFNPEVAWSNGYFVYVWQAQGGIWCRVTDDSGRTYLFDQNLNSLTGIKNPRVAVNGNYVLVCYQATSGTDQLRGRIIDCSTVPTISSETTLLSDIFSSKIGAYDISHNGAAAGEFLLAYINLSDERVGRKVTTTGGAAPVLGSTWRAAQAALAAHTRISVLQAQPSGTPAGVLAFVDSGSVRVEIYNTSSGAQILAATSHIPVGALEAGTGIAKITELSYLIVGHEQGTSSTPQILWWRWITSAGVQGITRSTARLRLESKPWTMPLDISGTDRQFCVVSTEDVFAVVELADTDASARPVATFGKSQQNTFGLGSGPRHMPSWVSADTFRRHTGVYLQAAGAETHGAGDHVILDFDDSARYQAAESGDLAYWASGLVQYTDGDNAHESGFLQTPQIHASNGTGTGLVANDIYDYVLVYEWFDRWGNYHQSPPSEVERHTVPDAGGSQGTVDLDLEHLSLTLRQRQTATQRRVQLAVYRANVSVAGAPASEVGVFYREYTIVGTPAARDNDPQRLSFQTINDNGTQFSNANPTLYTSGNVLEQDVVYGGGRALVRHKARIWVGGGEEPDVLWYSQEETEGRPAEFNLAQQVRIPGEEVNALASLDDALIAFSKDRIYAIFGEGPNSTGDPQSGSFTVPIVVHSDGGCDQPRGTVSTPLGVFFVGRQGFYLLDRSRSVQFIGDAVQDTFAAFPQVRSATYVQHRGEIRWLVRNAAETAWRVIVFDFESKKWAVWKYATERIGADSAYSAGSWYYVAKDGVVAQETSTYTDDGNWYGVKVTTGHLSFGDWQTLKRLRRVRVMLERRGTGGCALQLARNGAAFGAPTDSDTFVWTEAEVAALVEAGMRAHVDKQKGHRYQILVGEVEPASPDEGLAFIGFSYEVGMRTGVQRAPKADSK